jgi:surface antigen
MHRASHLRALARPALALLTGLLLTLPAFAKGPPHGHGPHGVPPGHMPPPGECRVWFPDRPPGHQPAPGPCEELRYRVPRGAILLGDTGRAPPRARPLPPPAEATERVVVEPAPLPPPVEVTEPLPPPPRDLGIRRGTCHRGTVGAILGGAVGGAVGSRIGEGKGNTAATIIGTLLGMAVGREVGRRMDEADRYCAGQALERADNHRSVVWRNPDTAATYRLTPTRSYRRDGRPCRDYRMQETLDGAIRTLTDSACRDADGAWRPME